jgi:hypothetical protein
MRVAPKWLSRNDGSKGNLDKYKNMAWFFFKKSFKITTFLCWDDYIMKNLSFTAWLTKSAIGIMYSTWFKNFIFLNFLYSVIITKIDACKIKYQLNIKIFVWDYNNLIKKLK